jgi:hypothetical protein
MAEFDLFLDESGEFKETDPDLAGRPPAAGVRPFPSQLAGILAPRRRITNELAARLRDSSQKAAGIDPGTYLHAKLVPPYQREALFLTVAQGITENGWQGFRLVNLERATYGNRETTYVHMVAELAFRVCKELSRTLDPNSEIRLNLVCARVITGEDAEGNQTQIDIEQYRRKITEYLGFVAVRNGRARNSGKWKLGNLTIMSPKKEIALQIADVVSCASHGDFRPCRDFPKPREALKRALGSFDFTLTVWELRERVRDLLAQGSPGAAIVALGEELITVGQRQDNTWREGFGSLAKEAANSLASMDGTAQETQHAQVLGWFGQVIEEKRDFQAGRTLYDWLSGLLPPESDPGHARKAFLFGLDVLGLALHNHTGNLTEARGVLKRLDARSVEMAGRWEHAPELLRAMVLKAVHLTDCLEFDEAARICGSVAKYYSELGSLFSDAMPGIFPARVRSDARGKALGTRLQAEIPRCSADTDDDLLVRARRVSEEAIGEFALEDDKRRQYQYRSNLETVAKKYREAAEWLAKSFAPGTSPDRLAESIGGLSEGPAKEFLALHFLRIAAAAVLDGDPAAASFALGQISPGGPGPFEPWRGQKEPPGHYPSHGILRRLAVIDAYQGRLDEAERSLDRLDRITREGMETSPVFGAIQVAALAEAAWSASRCRLAGANQEQARARGRRWLRRARELAGTLRANASRLPAFMDFFDRFVGKIDHQGTPEGDWEAGTNELKDLVRVIVN